MKKLLLVLSVMILGLALSGCERKDDTPDPVNLDFILDLVDAGVLYEYDDELDEEETEDFVGADNISGFANMALHAEEDGEGYLMYIFIEDDTMMMLDASYLETDDGYLFWIEDLAIVNFTEKDGFFLTLDGYMYELDTVGLDLGLTPTEFSDYLTSFTYSDTLKLMNEIYELNIETTE